MYSPYFGKTRLNLMVDAWNFISSVLAQLGPKFGAGQDLQSFSCRKNISTNPTPDLAFPSRVQEQL